MSGAGGDPSYYTLRSGLYRLLLASVRFDPKAFFDAALQQLPYKLGESAAETSVPFAVDDLLLESAEAAIAELVELLRRRRENDLTPKASGVSFDEKGTASVPVLNPPSYSVAAFAEGSIAKTVALRAERLDPLLDGALLEAWLLRGAGSFLVQHLANLLRVAIDEDLKNVGNTPYLFLATLVSVDLLEGNKSQAKSRTTRMLTWERLEKALGFACFAVLDAAQDRALAELRNKSLPFDGGQYAIRVKAMLTPMSFCAIRKSALSNDLNPWGLSQGLCDTLDSVWLSLVEHDPSPRTVEQRLLGAVRKDQTLHLSVARAAAVQELRRRITDLLVAHDDLDPELAATLHALLPSDVSLFEQLASPRALLGKLQKGLKGRRVDALADVAISGLELSLRHGEKRDDLVHEVTAAFTSLALDRAVAGAIDTARSRLRNRRNEFSREQLIADFNAGRLYRLSGDGKGFRRSLERRSQGHLFIDLKGFTQRTYRAKEIVMAEFLRTEFYEPILEAAAQKAQVFGRVTLQNLLGDAAVFSGEVPALIEVAREIQRICRRYGERLKGRTTADASQLETRRAEAESRCRAELERLRAESAQLESEMARKRSLGPLEREQHLWSVFAKTVADLELRARDAAAKGVTAEAERIRRDAAVLKGREKELLGQVEALVGNARDQLVTDFLLNPWRSRLRELEKRAAEATRTLNMELAAIEEEKRKSRGYGLEAGLFITYGAAAEIASMSHPAFGPVKVAIAEKINEAARGTARNGTLKAKLDAMVERTRAQGRPNVEYPFLVYVDSAFNLLLPADLNDLVERAVRERDPEKAREAARGIAERTLRDLARAMNSGDGQQPELLSTLSDIYNTGEALSGEALEAYLSATAATRFYFRRGVAVRELDREFHEKFCLLTDELQLVISVPHDGDARQAAIFRLAGQVVFRGFEAKAATQVYELLRPDMPFTALLAQKHLGLWIAEARAGGIRS